MDCLNKFLNVHKDFYDIALKEIRNGHKQTHWIWFIFPQIKGLGQSETAKFYEIKDVDEAKEYLKNDVLREHLLEITNALLELKNNDPLELLGYPDNLKLQSSMTLFNYIEPNNVFKKVLDKFYDGELDEGTISILEEQKKLINSCSQ